MNEGFEYRETVGPRAAGSTVLAHLAGRYRHSTASVWQARIDAGEVHLGGAPASATDCLRRGQLLVWRRPPWEEQDVPRAFAVLYRDEHLLAVAKPRGLPSLPGGGFLAHTLLHLVRGPFPGAVPMHRLGRGTSGIVLFARTAAARGAVSAAWRAGRVEKTYRALVQGVPPPGPFSIETPIGLVPHPRLGLVHAASPLGRPSRTDVRRLRVQEGAAVVEARIPTGRPHQIRIHLAAAGFPLVGDALYVSGGGPADEPALPGDTGYWLHAERLVLEHPVSGRPLVLECLPPPALRV